MKWFVGTLALLWAGILLRLELLVYAMYVLLAIMLLSRFLARTWMTGIEVCRTRGEETAALGSRMKVELKVTNRGRLKVPWMLVEEAVSPTTSASGLARFRVRGRRTTLSRLDPGETLTLRYGLEFLRRGYYQLGPTLLETGDLFGLYRRFRVVADPHYVLVPPKVIPLRGYDLASPKPVGEIRLSHRLFEDSTRLAGIRPYWPGDPLNRIHWRATAKTGELQSRVFESSCVAGATFVLDFHGEEEEEDVGGNALARTELAVTAVASMAYALSLQGQQIGLISNGRDAADRIRTEGWKAEFATRAEAQFDTRSPRADDGPKPVVVPTGKGQGQFQRILEALGRLELTTALDFTGLVWETESEITRAATVVAVVSRVTAPMAATLGQLRRNGYAVTAVVVDPREEPRPAWTALPGWAEMLVAEGIPFLEVESEASIADLCATLTLR